MNLANEVDEIRCRRLQDARRLKLGKLVRTFIYNGSVTMFFEKGELRYELPNGWHDGR